MHTAYVSPTVMVLMHRLTRPVHMLLRRKKGSPRRATRASRDDIAEGAAVEVGESLGKNSHCTSMKHRSTRLLSHSCHSTYEALSYDAHSVHTRSSQHIDSRVEGMHEQTESSG